MFKSITKEGNALGGRRVCLCATRGVQITPYHGTNL